MAGWTQQTRPREEDEAWQVPERRPESQQATLTGAGRRTPAEVQSEHQLNMRPYDSWRRRYGSTVEDRSGMKPDWDLMSTDYGAADRGRPIDANVLSERERWSMVPNQQAMQEYPRVSAQRMMDTAANRSQNRQWEDTLSRMMAGDGLTPSQQYAEWQQRYGMSGPDFERQQPVWQRLTDEYGTRADRQRPYAVDYMDEADRQRLDFMDPTGNLYPRFDANRTFNGAQDAQRRERLANAMQGALNGGGLQTDTQRAMANQAIQNQYNATREGQLQQIRSTALDDPAYWQYEYWNNLYR